MPKVSIIIPTYNSEKFLERAVNSVLNQTFRDWELIIVDDCSTDNTLQIIKKWEKNDKRIHSVFLKKNSGGSAHPRNKGFEISQGKYIAFLDHDDEWLPEKLSEQMNLFIKSSKKNLGLVACAAYLINNAGKCFGVYAPPKNKAIFPEILLRNPIYSNSSAILKREVVESVGQRDEIMKYSEDWDMWIRIAQAGYEIDFVYKPLFKYYFHETNTTMTLKGIVKVKDAEYIFQKHQDLYVKYDFLDVGFFRLGVMFFLGGDAKKSRWYFAQSIKKNKIFAHSYCGYILSFLGFIGKRIIKSFIWAYRLMHGKTYFFNLTK